MVAELLKATRRFPDRLLHARRRAAAEDAVRAHASPRTLLVICHGNTCRSPFAAAVLRRLLAPAGTTVESAGFLGPGRSPPPAALQAAARRDTDLTAHRSRPLTSELALQSELIVTMDAAQRREICARFGRHPRDVQILGDFDPEPMVTREIRDPIEQPPRVYAEVYDRILRCAGRLADAVAAAGPGGSPGR